VCQPDHHCCLQEIVRVGAKCWVLHPRSGVKPVAEGIAGNSPALKIAESGLTCSALMELREDGKQMVKITKMLIKNTHLMYPEEDALGKYLDDYVTPPAPHDTYVMWHLHYLSEMLEDA
jgi:hypothetical protein